MPTLSIYQVDAFASALYKGNPAAVVPLETWLPDATLQAIAAENNLAETAFFVPLPEGSGYKLRWFTPGMEVPLCGHATVATAYVLSECLKHPGPVYRFESMSGELRCTREGGRFVLDFPARPPASALAVDEFSYALGARPSAVFDGHYHLAVFETAAEIRALEPDFRKLAAIEHFAVIATAPGDEGEDFVSRFFAPRAGIDEDPVTGSAHCVLTPYWAARLGKTQLFARQLSKRGGEVWCELAGDRVKMGGHAVLYLTGQIFV